MAVTTTPYQYPVRPVEDRFFEKVEWGEVFAGRGTRCLLWTAYIDENGYGVFTVKTTRPDRKKVKPHRWLYERWVGPIPDGMEIDHLCQVRHCVNPDHLEVVTHAENNKRAGQRRTHCVNGHERTEANTFVTRRGARCCRICARRQKQESERRARVRKQQQKESNP